LFHARQDARILKSFQQFLIASFRARLHATLSPAKNQSYSHFCPANL